MAHVGQHCPIHPDDTEKVGFELLPDLLDGKCLDGTHVHRTSIVHEYIDTPRFRDYPIDGLVHREVVPLLK